MLSFCGAAVYSGINLRKQMVQQPAAGAAAPPYRGMSPPGVVRERGVEEAEAGGEEEGEREEKETAALRPRQGGA